jgi:hypothetical protein
MPTSIPLAKIGLQFHEKELLGSLKGNPVDLAKAHCGRKGKEGERP